MIYATLRWVWSCGCFCRSCGACYVVTLDNNSPDIKVTPKLIYKPLLWIMTQETGMQTSSRPNYWHFSCVLNRNHLQLMNGMGTLSMPGSKPCYRPHYSMTMPSQTMVWMQTPTLVKENHRVMVAANLRM